MAITLKLDSDEVCLICSSLEAFAAAIVHSTDDHQHAVAMIDQLYTKLHLTWFRQDSAAFGRLFSLDLSDRAEPAVHAHETAAVA